MPTYGSTHQVYGSRACASCQQPHASWLHIKETHRSRFKLMQFLAEVTARHPNGGIFTHDIGNTRYMVGLLISGGTIFVAASGNNNNRIQPAAQAKGYVLCNRITNPAGNRSRVGRVIPTVQYQAAQAPAEPSPGNCAAPRLIQHACANGHAGNYRTWEMSEVYYEPNTGRRTANDSYWMHGLSAHSCGTCENLVPLLMCPRHS